MSASPGSGTPLHKENGVVAREHPVAGGKPAVPHPQSLQYQPLPTSPGFQAINATGIQHSVLLGYWKRSTQIVLGDKNAVFGVTTGTDSFRLEVRRVTRHGSMLAIVVNFAAACQNKSYRVASRPCRIPTATSRPRQRYGEAGLPPFPPLISHEPPYTTFSVMEDDEPDHAGPESFPRNPMAQQVLELDATYNASSGCVQEDNGLGVNHKGYTASAANPRDKYVESKSSSDHMGDINFQFSQGGSCDNDNSEIFPENSFTASSVSPSHKRHSQGVIAMVQRKRHL
ncbi:hypothetical protein BKA61DRAFT_663436 [Leptodontidium sp. MPI-SDFR-AT-0119]|nr:hypothetical protein BKA61DRAFT_663436 [Leptodontidium sp. MPI-SDFR-AT-0119]